MDQPKPTTSLVLPTVAIGLFFATCMVMVEPLFLLWPLPLLLPFIAGAILAHLLRRRGWFALLPSHRNVLIGLLALPLAIALPVLGLIAETFIAAPRIEPPPGYVDLERSFDGSYVTFVSPHSISELKAYFRAQYGIKNWHDVRTPDPSDNPGALRQSVTPHGVEELWILLSRTGDQTFVEVSWSGSNPGLPYIIAGVGFLILISMIGVGPPRAGED